MREKLYIQGELREENAALKQEVEELRRKLERMNELLLLNAQRARFGQSGEKREYVMPQQLGLFNEAETEQNHKAPEPAEETLTVREHKRKSKRTADELTAGLPVKEVVQRLPEDQRHSAEPCHHVQLGNPDGPDLAEATVPAIEKAVAGRSRHLRG